MWQRSAIVFPSSVRPVKYPVDSPVLPSFSPTLLPSSGAPQAHFQSLCQLAGFLQNILSFLRLLDCRLIPQEVVPQTKLQRLVEHLHRHDPRKVFHDYSQGSSQL